MADIVKAEMQLPRKINPDNIRESVVEVRYHSKLSFEILVGVFFKEIEDSFTYTNRPIQPPAFSQGGGANSGQELTIKIGNANLFYNDKISIQVSPNTFVFTCLEHYIGWNVYEPEITKALKMFEKTEQIIKWTRVGIRYISEYPNKDLKECFKFNFSFGIPEVKSETTSFRTEFSYEDSKVILNLNNKVNVIKQNVNSKLVEITPMSLVDIDVISDNLEITNLTDLLNLISENHNKEKELYFRMMTSEFLTSLNPQY